MKNHIVFRLSFLPAVLMSLFGLAWQSWVMWLGLAMLGVLLGLLMAFLVVRWKWLDECVLGEGEL